MCAWLNTPIHTHRPCPRGFQLHLLPEDLWVPPQHILSTGSAIPSSARCWSDSALSRSSPSQITDMSATAQPSGSVAQLSRVFSIWPPFQDAGVYGEGAETQDPEDGITLRGLAIRVLCTVWDGWPPERWAGLTFRSCTWRPLGPFLCLCGSTLPQGPLSTGQSGSPGSGPSGVLGATDTCVQQACALTGPGLAGEVAAVDSEAVYQHLFARVPSEQFHSPMLAFEFIQFCRDNLHLFARHLSTLRLSFPNLFKAHLGIPGPPLTSEFVELLPALVDAGTALEMLHALLDLPCLTAALDLQLSLPVPPSPSQHPGTVMLQTPAMCLPIRGGVPMGAGAAWDPEWPVLHPSQALGVCSHRSSLAPSERPLWDTSLRIPSCLEAFRDPQFQGLFQYLLRPKASGTTER
ncbi:hypothetical protein P7K49_003984 [Saguinus oedipus]|uniref:Uncharacterized protein n=1 Tax=Saguinus oedipus TaxID=9490 RepID=A0ABQ9W8F5_SAGOE|nr:hypothetical protein P7K49_003984 [Saguinus oedipus]